MSQVNDLFKWLIKGVQEIIKGVQKKWKETTILVLGLVLFGSLFYSFFVDVRIVPSESIVNVTQRIDRFPWEESEDLPENTSVKVIVVNESPFSISSVFTYYTVKIKSGWQPDKVEIYYQFGEEPKTRLLASHEEEHIYLGHIGVGKEKEISLLFLNPDHKHGTTNFTIEVYFKLRDYQKFLTEEQGFVHWYLPIDIPQPGPLPSP